MHLLKTVTQLYPTDDGATWTTGAAKSDPPEVYNDLVFGNNTVGLQQWHNDRIIYSDNGTTWYDRQTCWRLGREDWKVGYTQGLFVLR